MLASFASGSAGAADAAQIVQGRNAYVSFCARCHGIDLATTGSAYDLRTFPREDRERFLRSVSKGLRAMPAWESSLKAEEIETIWAYVLSVKSGSQ